MEVKNFYIVIVVGITALSAGLFVGFNFGYNIGLIVGFSVFPIVGLIVSLLRFKEGNEKASK